MLAASSMVVDEASGHSERTLASLRLSITLFPSIVPQDYSLLGDLRLLEGLSTAPGGL
jgi:hypothetical protein